MPKKHYTSVPTNYDICIHSDCPMAKNCLHQLAYNQLKQTNTYLRLINPDKCSKDKACEHYRNDTPVRYAIGFTNFQKRMYPDQYCSFRSALIHKFSRNGFYERRRGATALSPKEQATVLSALREAGITEDFEFDGYEDRTNWYD